MVDTPLIRSIVYLSGHRLAILRGVKKILEGFSVSGDVRILGSLRVPGVS